jgi:cobalt/nickel transport system permease protein
MHLAEGTLPLAHAAAWTAVALPLLGWSLAGERSSSAEEPRSPLVGGATSLLFAATLLPLPVPVVGATSHVCLTPVLALLLGPRRVIWPTFFVLLLQALFFAHGGITTLGANTFTLGVVGPLAVVALAAGGRVLRLPSVWVVGIACGLADLAVYTMDAAMLAAALPAPSAVNTFGLVLAGFAPVQVPLAILEGIVSFGLVRTLQRRRPDLLPGWLRPEAGASGPDGGALVALALLLLATVTSSGCRYQGIDGTVFSAVATEAGQPATAPLLDASEGELGLAMTILVLFTCGFASGRTYERVLGGASAPSR